jgi:hypothetical protein
MAAGQTVGSAIPAMAVPIAGALPARMALGAAGGAVAGAGEGVAAPENFWSEKLPQMGAGAVGGAVGVPVAETAARTLGAVPNMLRWLTGQGPSGQQQVERFLSQLGSMTQSENRARDVLSQRFAEDAAAGGPSAEEAAARMERARGEGLPMTLADVGGENVRAVVGSAGRAGGPARGRLARWAVGRLGSVERDSPLMTNIEEGIEKYLATGSARTEARALAEQRAAAAPLWQTAMEGGNLVPVERTLSTRKASALPKWSGAPVIRMCGCRESSDGSTAFWCVRAACGTFGPRKCRTDNLAHRASLRFHRPAPSCSDRSRRSRSSLRRRAPLSFGFLAPSFASGEA